MKTRWIARMTQEASKVERAAPWARPAKPATRIRQDRADGPEADAA